MPSALLSAASRVRPAFSLTATWARMSFSVWARSVCRVPSSLPRAVCTPAIFVASAVASVFWAAATVPIALTSAASRAKPAFSLTATWARMSFSVWASSVVNVLISLPREVCTPAIFVVNAAVSVFWAAATVPSALLSAASRVRPAFSLIATWARMSFSV